MDRTDPEPDADPDPQHCREPVKYGSDPDPKHCWKF